MASLSISQQGLIRLRKKTGLDSDQQLAQRIGIDPATLSRVLNGKSEPGQKFLAGVLQAFGHRWFTELFQVVDDK
jgi:transcriptional regulator with XRE-family HTH domain